MWHHAFYGGGKKYLDDNLYITLHEELEPLLASDAIAFATATGNSNWSKVFDASKNFEEGDLHYSIGQITIDLSMTSVRFSDGRQSVSYCANCSDEYNFDEWRVPKALFDQLKVLYTEFKFSFGSIFNLSNLSNDFGRFLEKSGLIDTYEIGFSIPGYFVQ